MTNREFFEAVAKSNITAEVIEKANEEIDKLNMRNERRKNAETPNDRANAAIAQSIKAFLAEKGPTLSADIATALGLSTQKVNGVALQMVLTHELIDTKVKIKGKGERVAYSLPTVAEDVIDGVGDE